MSEFSFSYHLRTNDPQEVVNLLKSCGLKGYVFPSVNNWTTFVCEEEDVEENAKLINANTGLLVYYSFAEDFGWGFSIFKGNEKSAAIIAYGADLYLTKTVNLLLMKMVN